MGLSFEGLTMPVKIVPAAALSDDEFIAFSRSNKPYRFEKDTAGEIIVMTPAETGATSGRRISSPI